MIRSRYIIKKLRRRKNTYIQILAQLRITNVFFAKIERFERSGKIKICFTNIHTHKIFIQMNEFQYSINSDKKLIPLKMLKRKTFHISKD